MSPAACTCPPGELASTSCRQHGLYGDVRHPPMNRHARVKQDGYGPRTRETAAEVQKRLYLEAASDRHRIEAAGFAFPLRTLPPRGIGQR